MAKKNTYAAMMKQLSGKKAQYEKGLEEARRTGSRSGIADYERRLSKLTAGIDELFQAQQVANGQGGANFMKGGMTKKEGMYATGGTYADNLPKMKYDLPKAEGGMNTGDIAAGYGNTYTPQNAQDVIRMIGAARKAGKDNVAVKLIEYGFRNGYLNPAQAAKYGGLDKESKVYLDEIGRVRDNAMKRANREGHTDMDQFVREEWRPVAEGQEDPNLYDNLFKNFDVHQPDGNTSFTFNKDAQMLDPEKAASGEYLQAQMHEHGQKDPGYYSTSAYRAGIKGNTVDDENVYGLTRMPWDGRPGVHVDGNGNMYLGSTLAGPIVMTEDMMDQASEAREDWFWQTKPWDEFINDRSALAESGLLFDRESYGIKGTFNDDGSFRPAYDPLWSAGTVPASDVNTPPITTAPTPDPSIGGGGTRVQGTAPSTAPATTSTAPATTAPGTAALDAEQARRRAEANALGMAGARATTGDGTGHGMGLQLPGLDTPGTAPLPGLFGVMEQAGGFSPENQAAARRMEAANNTTAGTDAGTTPPTGLSNFMSKAGNVANDLSGSGLGMIAGAAAQFIPDLIAKKRMGDIQGPAMTPQQRLAMGNTNIDTTRALSQVQSQTSQANAAIDRNFSNPAVAAAMKRANMNAAQQNLGSILSNEASQELQLRNQNLQRAADVSNQNLMIDAQNRQRQIDFENERLAGMNRMDMQMGQKLGGLYMDFQNRAQDRAKWDMYSKIFDEDMLKRQGIDPTNQND